MDTYGYANTSWLDRLTSFNGASITYDAIGNPLSYNNGSAYTFTWQNGRDLASVVKGGVTTTYKYGADGQRIEKKYGSTTYNYYYADGLLVRQTWGTHYIDFLYDESGSPYSLIYDGVQYYYVKNVQGDVIQIRSVYGTLLVEYTYDAWGNVLSITGSNASVLGANNPIRYRSYYYDFETGFYYLNSRYYDPAIRRFINADGYGSTGQGFIGYNMYTYCLNNPVNLKDEDGEFAITTSLLVAAGIGALVGAVTSAISKIASDFIDDKLHGNKYEFDLTGVLISAGIGAVSGSLSVICPSATIAINAIAGATESVVDNLREGENRPAHILTDAIVDGGLSAITSSWGNDFVDNQLIDDTVTAFTKAFKYPRPARWKTAKKLANKLFKFSAKSFATGLAETLSISSTGTVINFVNELVFGWDEE